MFGIHPLDLSIIVAYFVVVILIGRRAAKAAGNQDGYFLAGRKLGRLYQFFLNFGNATDANGAVSTSSLVYQQGASGAWVGFQLIFLNPYYWFMNVWFRRVRLTTTADLFTDRLGSRKLASFYAIFQSLAAVFVVIGFGNLVTYKISAALVVKPAEVWTPAEQSAVEGFQTMRSLEKLSLTEALTAEQSDALRVLHERDARGELRSYITALTPLPLYIVYSIVIGAYVILGGLAATAVNEMLQGLLILVFSVILLPLGLASIGGFDALSERVPAAAFNLIGSSDAAQKLTAMSIFSLVLASLIQINGIIGNMGIGGSAKDEYAARFGAVSGAYGKRLIYIMWTLVGLVGLAMFQGENALADPDLVWGTMSRQLLGPGLLGLMFTGVLAANMSTVASQTVSVSALIVRNIYHPLRPNMSEAEALLVGRITVVVTLGLGILAAMQMDSVFSALLLVKTVSVPFGAVVLLMFFWRRLTVKGAWLGLIGSIGLNIVGPFVLPHVDALKHHPVLTARADDGHGGIEPVYFEKVVRTDLNDPSSPLEGQGRLHTELAVLKVMGCEVEQWTPAGRFSARFIFDSIAPFLLLIGFSLATKPPERSRLDRFYGRMKTPVGKDPQADREAVAATETNPGRFDHTKVLGPESNWEFTKWDRVDGIGFISCCAISGAIIGLFWLMLRMAAG